MDATLQDPLVGRLLDDRYLVLDRIDRGGMATVYHALDRRLDRDVALKVLHSHLAVDSGFTARFDREARASARLSHPNVVGMFDQGQDGDLHFLAMEYLPGRTLRQVLVERGALTPKETFRVMEPILDALFAAHRAGLIHRDVKPENVILTDDGRVKVADFGLARAATNSNATSGALLGTVAYIAPELVVSGTSDERSDVYAAGVMLFEMLTGRQPFVGEMAAQVAYRHVHENVPAPSTVAPNVPAALDEVVLAATAREPARRPVDAGAFLTMLRAAKRRIPGDSMNLRAEVPYAPGSVLPVPARAGFDAAAAAQAIDQAVENRTRALAAVPAATLTASRGAPDRGLHDARTALQTAVTAPRGRRVGLVGLPVNEDEGLALDDHTLARLAEQRRRRGLLVMSLVLVTAALFVAGSLWFVAGPGAQVVVPATTTQTQAEASKQLAAIPLAVKITTAFSDDVDKGLVIDSDPAAGTAVRKNSAVTLTVSKGPELFDVPTITGQTKDEAENILRGQDFRLGKVTEEFSDDTADGQVISQDPAANEQAAKGSAVDVVVSKGRELTEVPDVTGKSPDEARDILDDAGFTVTVSDDTRFDVRFGFGDVVATDPEPGSEAKAGSEVTLFVNFGEADNNGNDNGDGNGNGDNGNNDGNQNTQVQVPFLINKTEDEARQELERLGLQVEVERRNDSNNDRVSEQDPFFGRSVQQGSTVKIIFS